MKARYKSYCTIKDVIKNSIIFEKETAEFYKKMKEYADKETTRDLVDFLIEQEYLHKRKLESIKFIKNPKNMIQFPPELEQTLFFHRETLITFSSLLDKAIEIEKFSQRIYKEASLQYTGEIKDLLLSLAIYEKKHEHLLKELKFF